MNHVESRALGLAVLAAAAIGLALAGQSAGFVGGLADEPSVGTVNVDRNVTFSDGTRNVTLVEDLRAVDSVEIAETTDGFRVETTRDEPFTGAQRERAKTIAKRNATVRRYLDGMDAYELSVEPVVRINASQMHTAMIDLSPNATTDAGTFSGDVETVRYNETGGSVVVDRDPTYVEGEAVVRIGTPASERSRYWVDVDLANGTVTDVTDWETAGQSP